MGDMGQRNKLRSQKRIFGKRRRSNKNSDVLAWLPDGYRKNTPANRKVMSRWLSGSFLISNPKSIQKLPDHVIEDMTKTMAMVASSVSSNGQCEITISEPDATSPYWGNDMSMVVNGVLCQTTIESLDVNDLMTASLGWINQAGIK